MTHFYKDVFKYLLISLDRISIAINIKIIRYRMRTVINPTY